MQKKYRIGEPVGVNPDYLVIFNKLPVRVRNSLVHDFYGYTKMKQNYFTDAEIIQWRKQTPASEILKIRNFAQRSLDLLDQAIADYLKQAKAA